MIHNKAYNYAVLCYCHIVAFEVIMMTQSGGRGLYIILYNQIFQNVGL